MIKNRITISYYKYYLNKYIGLIHKLVRQNRLGADVMANYVDFCQAELLCALGRFDSRRKVSLTTFIYARLSGRLKHEMYKNNNKGYVTETDSSCPAMDKSILMIDNTETSLFVKEMLATLDPVERSIVTMYYLEGHSLRQTAEVLQISLATVHESKRNILARLRDRFSQVALER